VMLSNCQCFHGKEMMRAELHYQQFTGVDACVQVWFDGIILLIFT